MDSIYEGTFNTLSGVYGVEGDKALVFVWTVGLFWVTVRGYYLINHKTTHSDDTIDTVINKGYVIS
jgi:hypothetical protein